jgi:hypothetical protein
MNHKSSQPLSCNTAAAWIHLLLDHALAPEQQEKLAAHLQTCAHCRAAHEELKHIESAHAELADRTPAPAEDYFASLPARVMARIAAAGEPPATAPARAYSRKPLAFNLREFIFGRGRYALAFAAMVALVFIITRQLREQGAAESARQEAVQSVYQEEPKHSATPKEESRFSSPNKMREANAPVQPQALPSESRQAQAEPPATRVEGLPAPPEPIAQPDESAIAAADESAADQMALAATTPSEETARDTFAAAAKRVEIGLVHNPQPEPSAAARGAIPQEARGRPQQSSSAFSTAAQSPARVYMKASKVSLSQEAERLASETNLQQVLTLAARMHTEAERIKIWQSYLGETEIDSASYNLAVENVARRLAATIDTSAAIARVQEALIFYQTFTPVLVTRLGREGYEREKIRLEELLNRKKSLER